MTDSASGLAGADVAALALDEQIALLSGEDSWRTTPTRAVPALFMADGPHGLRKQAGATDIAGLNPSLPATCYPTASSLGSTWDEDLAYEIGAALGAEAAREGIGLVLGPGMNIKRHPAGGRNFEYLSEDPLLSGRMAAATVRGVQSRGVGACLKHYAVNNQEHERLRVDAIVDEQTLHEIYLRGFEIAVTQAAPWAVMAAYNRVNGTPMSHHAQLLREVLRDSWGFDGLVVSDWHAVSDRAAGVLAGLDLEMPSSAGTWDRSVRRAVARGHVQASEVTACATRVADIALRADSQPRPPEADHAQEHALARRAASAGTVLLTNDGLLPLPGDAHLAVVGAFAEAPRFQGAGSSRVNARTTTSLLEALSEAEVKADYVPAYDPTTGRLEREGLAAARETASQADAVVVLVGLPDTWEAEGFDRTTLDLPDDMDALVEAMAAANPRVVVVVCAGAPVLMPWADSVSSIVLPYLAGQASGASLADVLLGVAEPGGRLAESWPVTRSQLPADRDFAAHPTQVQYREGPYVGYRFHDTFGSPAAFPFGHGMSYAAFSCTDVTATEGERTPTVKLTLTNESERSGSTVVQVYAHRASDERAGPEQWLCGFAKVALAGGASARVEVPLDARTFDRFDVGTGAYVRVGGAYELRVGFSSTDIVEALPLTVEGAVAPGPDRRDPWPGDDEFAQILGRAVPEPDQVYPFTRETTLRDVIGHPCGALLRAAVRGGPEPSTPDPVGENFFNGTTMRGIAAASQGRVPLWVVDLLIRVLNATTPPSMRSELKRRAARHPG